MSKRNRKKRKGRMAAAICLIFGIAILVLAAGMLLPVTLPRFMGYAVYNVISDSMKPEMPVLSAAFVQYEAPETLHTGDIIVYMDKGMQTFSRVTENVPADGKLYVRTDIENKMADPAEVQYDLVTGKVVKHLPHYGQMVMILAGAAGKLLMICLFACGVLLIMVSGRFRAEQPDLSGVNQ